MHEDSDEWYDLQEEGHGQGHGRRGAAVRATRDHPLGTSAAVGDPRGHGFRGVRDDERAVGTVRIAIAKPCAPLTASRSHNPSWPRRGMSGERGGPHAERAMYDAMPASAVTGTHAAIIRPPMSLASLFKSSTNSPSS